MQPSADAYTTTGLDYLQYPDDTVVGTPVIVTLRFKISNPGESFIGNTNTAPQTVTYPCSVHVDTSYKYNGVGEQDFINVYSA